MGDRPIYTEILFSDAKNNVTNITLTGSTMVNWSRDLRIQGWQQLYVVSIHALGLIGSENTRTG